MPDEYCKLHDTIVGQEATNFEYDVAYAHGTQFYHYEVDLVAMTQNNSHALKVRPLRRLVSQTPYTCHS